VVVFGRWDAFAPPTTPAPQYGSRVARRPARGRAPRARCAAVLACSRLLALLPRWLCSWSAATKPCVPACSSAFNFWIYPLIHWPMQMRQLANIKRNAESNWESARAKTP